MSGKRGKPLVQNSFAALAHLEEQEPKKALQLSNRNQKKLEYQAKKALCSPGFGAGSTARQQPRAQQRTSSTNSAAAPGSSSPSRRDSLEEALARIAIAESEQSAQHEEMLRQQYHNSTSSFAAAAAAAAAASNVAANPQRAASLAPTRSCSLSASPPVGGDSACLWQNLPSSSTSDPWSTSSPSQQQKTPCSEHSLSPAHSFASMLLQQAQQEEQQQPQRPQQQQQQEERQEHWPALGGQGAQDAAWESCGLTSGQAYSWRSFAMRFAEAAWEAGDEDAADGALLFSASETLSAAVFAAADDTAVAELEDAAAQAAAAGLTVQELLQAQQEELLMQISRAKRKGPAWRQVQLDWANSSSSTSGKEVADPGSSSSSRGVLPAQILQLPDVDDDSAFPQLEAAASPGIAPWQQAGRSPHHVPKGWRGGRMAPNAKGIKLLHTPSSSSSRPEQQFRPSQADLHWDLRLEGLVPMQREGEQEHSQLLSIDPWGGVANPSGYSEQEAADRTRQLLTEQHAAAAAADGLRPAPASSSRDRYAQDAVRAMMQKAAAKGARPGSAGTSQPAAAAAAAGDAGDEEGGMCGSKAAFSYSWSNLFKAARAAGWVPVSKAEGGGGSHFKLRRVLPKSGVTQTQMLACTPSDTQRGVRNAAAAFKKKDDEARQLEAAAAHKQAEGTPGKAGGKCKS